MKENKLSIFAIGLSLIAVVVLISVATHKSDEGKMIETINKNIKELNNTGINVGGVPGNRFEAPSIVVNGEELFPNNKSFAFQGTTGTTTLCSIQSPAATSTLITGGFTLTSSATSGPVLIEIGKSVPWLDRTAANLTSTTTLLATSSVNVGQQITLNFFATTTSGATSSSLSVSPALFTQASADRIFAPYQSVSVKAIFKGGGVEGQLASGTCMAIFADN